MSDKLSSAHLQRGAYVYVRQSSMHQVRSHQEGQRWQYALADRARHLGFARVIVIDDDLGRSGSGKQDRPGFTKLLAAVCQADAGAVFALEASRLARNNRDWHHLIDLCAITETLLVDEDGIYDPRLLNDRLLLGLKGSMAEFELGLIRQRAREAFLDMVRRGLVMWEIPVGLIRTEDYRVEMIADRQVQEAIHGVFRKFRELAAPGRFSCGIATKRFPFRTWYPAVQAGRSSGPFLKGIASCRSSTAPGMPGRSPMGVRR